MQVAAQGVVSRSAKRAMVLRYTTDRFHSRMTSKFAVPSPNGAPALQPLVFRRLAVEASTSGTLRQRSTCPSQEPHRHALKRKPARISLYRYMRTAIGPRRGATLVERDIAIINSLFVLPFLAEPFLPGEFGGAPRRLCRAHF